MLERINQKLLFMLEVLGIVVLLFFLFQMFMDYKYKAAFVLTPCELCVDLNPQYAECFDYAGTVVKDSAGNVIATGKEAGNYLKGQNAQMPYPNVTLNLSAFKS